MSSDKLWKSSWELDQGTVVIENEGWFKFSLIVFLMQKNCHKCGIVTGEFPGLGKMVVPIVVVVLIDLLWYYIRGNWNGGLFFFIVFVEMSVNLMLSPSLDQFQ